MTGYDYDLRSYGTHRGQTLAHYERHADEFWQGTRDHDVSQTIAALRYIEAPPPFDLLDFGCGQDAISRPSGKSATNPPVLREQSALPRWRVPTAAAKYCSKIFSR